MGLQSALLGKIAPVSVSASVSGFVSDSAPVSVSVLVSGTVSDSVSVSLSVPVSVSVVAFVVSVPLLAYVSVFVFWCVWEGRRRSVQGEKTGVEISSNEDGEMRVERRNLACKGVPLSTPSCRLRQTVLVRHIRPLCSTCFCSSYLSVCSLVFVNNAGKCLT